MAPARSRFFRTSFSRSRWPMPCDTTRWISLPGQTCSSTTPSSTGGFRKTSPKYRLRLASKPSWFVWHEISEYTNAVNAGVQVEFKRLGIEMVTRAATGFDGAARTPMSRRSWPRSRRSSSFCRSIWSQRGDRPGDGDATSRSRWHLRPLGLAGRVQPAAISARRRRPTRTRSSRRSLGCSRADCSCGPGHLTKPSATVT